MLTLKDLRNIICTNLHVYDSKTKTWHTNVSVTSNLFKELQDREVIGIRDITALPLHVIHNAHINSFKSIVISII